jgi:outer membrane protein OmpA-like peptidoglycan-associated protein
MSFKAEKKENVNAGQKQRSSQQTTRNFGLSAHQIHPHAIIQKAELDSHSLTPQDVLHLQRTIGNHAVGRLLTQAKGNTSSIGARVEALMQRMQTPDAIRAALGADPSLGAVIQAFFAMGNDNPQLNSLLAQAFPSGGRSDAAGKSSDNTVGEAERTKAEKGGTGAGATLPAARTGNKKLTKGTYSWDLSPVTTSEIKLTADFKPDHTKVDAKAVSFAQTVLSQVGTTRGYAGGTVADPAKKKATYQPFEESTKHTRMDFHPGTENDPYYGAEWDQTNKKWVRETTAGSAVGSSAKGVSSTSAKLSDPPTAPWAREGKGQDSSEFETVAIVLETRDPLGALKWGYKIKDKADAPIELTGAKDADCVDAPSAEWGKAMDKFYEARFETILDNFDSAKADLKPDHKTKLDGIVTRMKANAALKAQLGGAADLKEADVSLKRAEAARDYLVGKGIAVARIEIENYGSDWARVETTKGTSEGKNRRVQVWLR